VSENKQSAYMNVRRDMLLFNPTHVSTILDVGCYTGATGKFLKSVNPQLRIVGVDVVEEAREVYEEAYLVDLDQVDALACLEAATFDVILLGDVLEHLKEPHIALSALVRHLAKGGKIICSLPNIQFWEAIATIIFGGFPRRPAGIFDQTHLRFFTKREALALFSACDIEVVDMKRNIMITENKPFLFLNRLTVVLGPLLRLFGPYFTYQFIFVLQTERPTR
jgi:2-polyprenyl-3-methyl-5-hydroxy-6-metoxy-1,4-benzoquinol methylase